MVSGLDNTRPASQFHLISFQTIFPMIFSLSSRQFDNKTLNIKIVYGTYGSTVFCSILFQACHIYKHALLNLLVISSIYSSLALNSSQCASGFHCVMCVLLVIFSPFWWVNIISVKDFPGPLLKDMSGCVGMIDYVRLGKPQTHAASLKRLAELQSVLSGSSDLLLCHWSHCEQGKIS